MSKSLAKVGVYTILWSYVKLAVDVAMMLFKVTLMMYVLFLYTATCGAS